MVRMLRSLEKLIRVYGKDQGSEWQLGILQHAWSLNANMLFAPPDARLLLLYYRIVWNSGLVQLPEAGLQAADKLYTAINDKVPAGPIIALEMEKVAGGYEEFFSDSLDSSFGHFAGQRQGMNRRHNKTVKLYVESIRAGEQKSFQHRSGSDPFIRYVHDPSDIH